MNCLKPWVRTGLIATALAAGSWAQAAITISSTTVNWTGTTGGTGVVLNATNGNYTDVRWGTPFESAQSGLGFDPANPPAQSWDPGANFLLGSLQHYNNPLIAGSQATAAFMTLSVGIAGATPSAQNFSFSFLIDETPNSGTCAYPSVTPCADRITFGSSSGNGVFEFEGLRYTLELVGFSRDGGRSILSDFISDEGGTRTAGLYARFVAPAEVPEPGSLALMASALVALGVTVRRRRPAR